MWWEALIMLIFYIGYIVIMKFNKNLEGLVSKLPCISTDDEDADTEQKIPMNQNIVKNQERIHFKFQARLNQKIIRGLMSLDHMNPEIRKMEMDRW